MKIITVESYEKLSEMAAEIICNQVNSKPESILGLATGSSPVGAYKKMAEFNKEGKVDVEYEPVFRLGSDRRESIAKMAKVEELCEKFPGLDCGSCGAPSCRALAEDIVRGFTETDDCIFKIRENVRNLINQMLDIESHLPPPLRKPEE